MKNILGHWKTSLGGLIMAILVAIQPLVMDVSSFDFQKDWMRYLVAILIAVVGFTMKDPNKKINQENGL